MVRVHRDILESQKLPTKLVANRIWQERFKDIRSFERYLAHNGVLVLKFFLYVSKEQQRKRFLERLEEPAKRWKFSMRDVEERKRWDRYMTAYEEMIRHTSTAHAPWHVVPADHKWFTHLVVAATMIQALDRLNLKFPTIKREALKEMKQVKKALLAESSPSAEAVGSESAEEKKEKPKASIKPRPRSAPKRKKRRRLRVRQAKYARARVMRVRRSRVKRRKLSVKSSAPRRRSRPARNARRRSSGSRAKSSRARAARVPRRRGRRRKPRAVRRRAPR